MGLFVPAPLKKKVFDLKNVFMFLHRGGKKGGEYATLYSSGQLLSHLTLLKTDSCLHVCSKSEPVA